MKHINKLSPYKILPVLLPVIALAGVMLTACGRQKSSSPDAMSPMEISEMPLSDRERDLISLVDTHSSSRIFRYKADDKLKKLIFSVEEFKDGEMVCLARTGGPAPSEGSLSVLMDPDEITVSWDGGRYSCLINSTSGYRSSITSHLSTLSSFHYNEKEVLAMVANTQSDTITSGNVTDYHNLPDLEKRGYDRVLFVTVTFSDTDTPSEDGSADSLEYDGGSQNNNTKAPSLSKQADSEFENRILFADGAIYYGTSEIGPMGDSGSVDGYISSSLEPEAIPGEEGQSNFGCIGSPYTWDSGDGRFMVLSEDKEWHIFQRRKEAKPSGSYCAFIRRMDNDNLWVDMAEWITPEDKEKVRSLKLTEHDMPDGYYIHNPSRSRTILKLTADTQYRFIDWGRSFSDSDEPEMPFFIEVENGAVTLIEEKPIA